MVRKPGFLLLAFVVFLSVSCFVVPVSVTQENVSMTHTLPNPSDAVVVRWQTLGGLSGIHRRRNEKAPEMMYQ
jgi:hypothetical protein